MRSLRLPLFLFFCCVLWGSCNTDSAKPDQQATVTPEQQKECVRRFMAADDSLGKIRNHASENLSLSKTILQYESALRGMNFGNCLPAFSAAIKKHLDAWHNVVKFTDRYPDLRGEMHDLFSQLESGKDAAAFKPLVDAIWDTWADVEQFIK